MVYISAKLLESNGIVTFSTPTKKKPKPVYDTTYKNPWLSYCPTALDVKIGNSIQNVDSIYNDVFSNVTAAIQSTNNAAINRQLIQYDPVFYSSNIENIISDEVINDQDWISTSVDLGVINEWTIKRYYGVGDIQPGYQKQFIFNSTNQCVDLFPQSNQILLQYDLTKDENAPIIICTKYLTVIGAILSDSVNSTISNTKDIGYLFERKKTMDDRYFVVIDPKLISRENKYYGTLTISLSITEEDFEVSKVAGIDGVGEDSNTSNYANYQCNNDAFEFRTFKPVSTRIVLDDGKSIKTFDGYDSISGCVVNVTPSDTTSLTTNIQNLHNILGITETIDIRQYVANAEILKDCCGNNIGGILMADFEGIWYSRDGFEQFDVPEVDGRISTTSAPPSSIKKTSLLLPALPPPASTNTVLNSKINQTPLGLQSNMQQSKPVNPILQESSVKPPCDCGN